MPPIFSSNSVAPIARSMPKFVPIPTSPSRRAPVVGRQRALQVVVAALGGRRDDEPVAELEVDARDVDAGRRGRHAEADAPVGARLVRAR